MATMNEQEMRTQIASLQEEVSKLEQELKSRHRRERDRFSQRLAVWSCTLILAALGLIGAAIWMRYQVEMYRYTPRTSDAPIANNVPNGSAVPKAPATSASIPSTLPAPEPVAQQPKSAREVLDDYIDREARKTGASGGNTYSLSVDGIKGVIDALAKTGQLAGAEVIKLKDDLTKNAIATTSEIVKETAKAVIARYIAPAPESKANAGGPAQQVQVNVYAHDRQLVASRPNPAPTPRSRPKSPAKASCPTAVLTAEPARCPLRES